MTVSRIILFKMPSLERPQYVQKILDILGSPPDLIIKLTTYRSKWIPLEVYDNPEKLEKQLAWMVCVDAKRNNKDGKIAYEIERYIPIREVKIVKAMQRDGTLMLWLEMRNYLKCDDYKKFREELERTGKKLPPEEGGYIIDNVDISSVTLIDPKNKQIEDSAWKAILDSIGTMEAFKNSVFYRIFEVSDVSISMKPENIEENGEPINRYKLSANKTYQLKIHYYLPEKQFEFCPQTIKTSAVNDWVKFYGESKINDRTDDITIKLKPLQVSDPHPYNNTIKLDVGIEGQLYAPKIGIPIILESEETASKIKRNVATILCSAAFITMFVFGQLLQGMFPPINDISPTWNGVSIQIIGIAFSTFAITLVPIAVGLWKKEDNVSGK